MRRGWGRGVSWGLTRRGGRGGERGAPPVDSALRAREPAYGNFLLLEGGRLPYAARRGGWKPPFHGLRSVPWSPCSLVYNESLRAPSNCSSALPPPLRPLREAVGAEGRLESLHSMGYAVPLPGPLVPWSITNLCAPLGFSLIDQNFFFFNVFFYPGKKRCFGNKIYSLLQ